MKRLTKKPVLAQLFVYATLCLASLLPGVAFADTSGQLLIDEDTVLDGNHYGQIIFMSDGIELDCNGFSVINDGTTAYCPDVEDTGTVYRECGIVADGVANIAIRNCTTMGFEWGTWVWESSNVVIEDNTSTSNTGFRVEQSNTVSLRDNLATNGAWDGYQLRNNVDEEHDFNRALGMLGDGWDTNLGTDGEFRNNIANMNGGNGFEYDGATGLFMSQNRAWNGERHGISLDFTSAFGVFDSVTTGSFVDGLRLQDCDNGVIMENFSHDNDVDKTDEREGCDLFREDGSNLTFQNNNIGTYCEGRRLALSWASSSDYEVGVSVSYEGKIYEARQAHTSVPGWTPPVVPALWHINPRISDWKAWWVYGEDAIVLYEGATYRAVVGHESDLGLEPPNAPALWEAHDIQWEAQTRYELGIPVVHNGTQYRAIQAHTSLLGWDPPYTPALWEQL